MQPKIIVASLLSFFLAAGFQGLVAAENPDKTSYSSEKLESLGSAGDAEAFFILAGRFDTGGDEKEDLARAAGYYERASDLGHLGAKFNLASMYFHGEGVGKNPKKGLKLLEQSAALGLGDAESNLGVLYRDGVEVRQDSGKALSHFKKAAEEGSVPGMFNFANMHDGEHGIAKDCALMLEWLEKASLGRYPPALTARGKIAENGDCGEKDAMLALQNYTLAAALGDEEAKLRVGALHLAGPDEVRDPGRGKDELRRAAAAGDKSAMEILRSMLVFEEHDADNRPEFTPGPDDGRESPEPVFAYRGTIGGRKKAGLVLLEKAGGMRGYFYYESVGDKIILKPSNPPLAYLDAGPSGRFKGVLESGKRYSGEFTGASKSPLKARFDFDRELTHRIRHSLLNQKLLGHYVAAKAEDPDMDVENTLDVLMLADGRIRLMIDNAGFNGVRDGGIVEIRGMEAQLGGKCSVEIYFTEDGKASYSNDSNCMSLWNKHVPLWSWVMAQEQDIFNEDPHEAP